MFKNLTNDLTRIKSRVSEAAKNFSDRAAAAIASPTQPESENNAGGADETEELTTEELISIVQKLKLRLKTASEKYSRLKQERIEIVNFLVSNEVLPPTFDDNGAISTNYAIGSITSDLLAEQFARFVHRLGDHSSASVPSNSIEGKHNESDLLGLSDRSKSTLTEATTTAAEPISLFGNPMTLAETSIPQVSATDQIKKLLLEKEAELKALSSELLLRTSEKTSLLDEVNSLRKEKDSLVEKSKLVIAKFKELQASNKELQSKYDLLSSSTPSSTSNVVIPSKKEDDENRIVVQMLTQRNVELEAQITTLSSTNSDHASAIAALDSQLSIIQSHEKTLELENSQLKQTVIDYRNLEDNYKKKIHVLNDQVVTLSALRSDAMKRAFALGSTIDALIIQRDEFSELYKNLTQQQATTNNSVAAISKQRDAARTRLTNITTMLNEANEKNTSLENQVHELSSRLQEQSSQLSSECLKCKEVEANSKIHSQSMNELITMLQTQLKESQDTIEALKSSTAVEAKLALDALTSEKQVFENRIAELEQRLQDAEQTILVSKNEFETVNRENQTSISTLTHDLELSTKDKESLSTSLREMELLLNEERDSKRDLTDLVTRLTLDLNHAKAAAESSESTLNALRNESKSELVGSASRISDLERELLVATESRKTLREKSSELEHEVLMLKSKLVSAQNELAISLERIETSERKALLSKQEVIEAQSQLNGLISNAQSLQSDLSMRERELSAAQSHIQALHGNFDQVSQKNAANEAHLRSLTEELRLKSDDLILKTKTVGELEKRCAELDKVTGLLRTQIEGHESTLAAVLAAKNEDDSTTDSLSKSLEAAKSENQVLASQLSEKAEQVSRLLVELEEAHASKAKSVNKAKEKLRTQSEAYDAIVLELEGKLAAAESKVEDLQVVLDQKSVEFKSNEDGLSLKHATQVANLEATIEELKANQRTAAKANQRKIEALRLEADDALRAVGNREAAMAEASAAAAAERASLMSERDALQRRVHALSAALQTEHDRIASIEASSLTEANSKVASRIQQLEELKDTDKTIIAQVRRDAEEEMKRLRAQLGQEIARADEAVLKENRTSTQLAVLLAEKAAMKGSLRDALSQVEVGKVQIQQLMAQLALLAHQPQANPSLFSMFSR
jgi:early endosome antigen 1